MKSIFKLSIIIISIIIVIGIIIGIYLYFKPQADISKKRADVVLKASELYNEYSSNENQANTKYLNKIVEVSGPVAELTNNPDSSLTIILRDSSVDFGLNCNILKNNTKGLNKLQKGVIISIRGVCSGYNSIEVALNNCALVK